jgi:hypothetical protein
LVRATTPARSQPSILYNFLVPRPERPRGAEPTLPARIVNEELGDYIEDLNRRAARG